MNEVEITLRFSVNVEMWTEYEDPGESGLSLSQGKIGYLEFNEPDLHTAIADALMKFIGKDYLLSGNGEGFFKAVQDTEVLLDVKVVI